MTATTDADHRCSTGESLRQAQRAWFRAGVRRHDRRTMACDLRAELSAAQVESVSYDVLGDDPAATARDWAQARGLVDRRLRLLTFVVPALLAGVVASGAVLALLADAFSGDGNTVLGTPGPTEILSIYAGSGVLAALAMCTVTGLVLRAQHDSTATSTVRSLLALLPAGAIAAAVAGVSTADSYGFSTTLRTVTSTCLAVVIVLALTISTARWLAVRKPRTETAH